MDLVAFGASPPSRQNPIKQTLPAREDDEPVRGNHDGRGCTEAMHWRTRCIDAATVACRHGIDPVLIHIAIERLDPAARVGKADRIAPPGGVGKRRDDNDIGARVEPAVVGDDSVLVMDVESTHVVAAQGGLIPTEAD